MQIKKAKAQNRRLKAAVEKAQKNAYEALAGGAEGAAVTAGAVDALLAEGGAVGEAEGDAGDVDPELGSLSHEQAARWEFGRSYVRRGRGERSHSGYVVSVCSIEPGAGSIMGYAVTDNFGQLS